MTDNNNQETTLDNLKIALPCFKKTQATSSATQNQGNVTLFDIHSIDVNSFSAVESIQNIFISYIEKKEAEVKDQYKTIIDYVTEVSDLLENNQNVNKDLRNNFYSALSRGFDKLNEEYANALHCISQHLHVIKSFIDLAQYKAFNELLEAKYEESEESQKTFLSKLSNALDRFSAARRKEIEVDSNITAEFRKDIIKGDNNILHNTTNASIKFFHVSSDFLSYLDNIKIMLTNKLFFTLDDTFITITNHFLSQLTLVRPNLILIKSE